MKYLYECPHCEIERTVTKLMAEASKKEFCKKCEKEMKRIYASFGIKTSDGYKAGR